MQDGNVIAELLTQALKVGVGATTEVVELLQDPNGLPDKVFVLQEQFNQGTLASTLESKGEKTVTEARSFIDGIIASQTNSSMSTADVPFVEPYPIEQLQALIRDLEKVRTQLRQSRNES